MNSTTYCTAVETASQLARTSGQAVAVIERPSHQYQLVCGDDIESADVDAILIIVECDWMADESCKHAKQDYQLMIQTSQDDDEAGQDENDDELQILAGLKQMEAAGQLVLNL